jgi:ubiquinone/menaquinone biosynthesis C-methylase UbiE
VGTEAKGRARLVGCDLSRDMLRVARTRVTRLQVVAAHAEALPFADAAFDVVTASFVLSHLRDYRAGIAEAHRILRSSGTLAVVSWTARTDPQSEAWRALLREALSASRIEDASAEVTPSEAFFERRENVSAALTDAGFTEVEVRTYALKSRSSLEQFLADRALSSSGRFARQAMSQSAWPRLLDQAREQLTRSFGTDLSYSREFHVGIGHRA